MIVIHFQKRATRSAPHGGAYHRLHFRLRLRALHHPAATGIENAGALTPKLREGPLDALVRVRGGRDDGVQSAPDEGQGQICRLRALDMV